MFTRRNLLQGGALASGAPAILSSSGVAAGQGVQPAPCDHELTPTFCWSNIPEYMWGAPERTSLLTAEGQRLTLIGRVLTRGCKPVAGARLEFWHAGPNGQYDYAGFKFRGSQRTDKDGRFLLETIMPGYYSPRRHIHYLVGIKRDGASGILLTNSVGLPSDEEFRAGALRQAEGDVVEPKAIVRKDGRLMVPYDIIIDMA